MQFSRHIMNAIRNPPPRCGRPTPSGRPCCLDKNHFFSCIGRSPPPRPRVRRGMRKKADYEAHMDWRMKWGPRIRTLEKEEKAGA